MSGFTRYRAFLRFNELMQILADILTLFAQLAQPRLYISLLLR